MLIENGTAEAEIRLTPGGGNTTYNLSADDGGGKFRIYAGTNPVFQILEDNDLQAVIRADLSAQNDDGWVTAAVDYAEFMEKLDYQEDISVFELVGIKNGKITKNTDGATLFMVTATDAGLRGGNPMCDSMECSRDNDPNWLAVAFIGQMPLLVEGEVKEGDYIIPSGKNDGKAIAVSKDKINTDQFNQLVGVALESSANPTYQQKKYVVDVENELNSELAKLQERKGKYSIINVAVSVNFGMPKNILDSYSRKIGELEKNYLSQQERLVQMEKLVSELQEKMEYNNLATSKK